jgi:glycosyltransferase involved in cell wall biosynthesis
MRLAFVTHLYPPTSCGGAGQYTAALAEAFSKAGWDVAAICADDWGIGPGYLNGVSDEFRNGVRLRRLSINWKKARRPYDWLYDSPVAGEQVRKFFQEIRPDIVHVSSCYTLSARPVFVAKAMGIATVMHLHDYWTICARHTLLHKDNSICSGPTSVGKCQRCLLSGTDIWDASRTIIGAELAADLLKLAARSSYLTRRRGMVGTVGDWSRRREFVASAMNEADLLVTPTEFARRQISAHSEIKTPVVVMNYGNDMDWASEFDWKPSRLLRIGFLGNVIPIKGVHILLEAFRRLSDEAEDITLRIWGNTDLAPDYVQQLKRMSPGSVFWGGRYERSDLGRILADLDVVVVPSIWYETQGIVVQEAFAAGLPVIASRGTSLQDTVEHNVNGLLFEIGSSEDLFQQLLRLRSETSLLGELRAGIKPVREIGEDVAELGGIYNELKARVR